MTENITPLTRHQSLEFEHFNHFPNTPKFNGGRGERILVTNGISSGAVPRSDALASLKPIMDRFLSKFTVPNNITSDIKIVMAEALANAQKYGNGNSLTYDIVFTESDYTDESDEYKCSSFLSHTYDYLSDPFNINLSMPDPIDIEFGHAGIPIMKILGDVEYKFKRSLYRGILESLVSVKLTHFWKSTP